MTKALGILVVFILVLGPVVAYSDPMPNAIHLNKRAFMVFGTEGPLGTAFRICQPNVVLTAAHVVGERRAAEVAVVSTFFAPLKIFTPVRIERHPQADIAALFLNGEAVAQAGLECFELGVPENDYPGFSDYPLGTDVLAYGFPKMTRKPIPPRMMKGHIQSKYQHDGTDAYELAFPAFGGLSGSPVILDHNRRVVIALVTNHFSYTTYTPSKESPAPAESMKMERRADWALGAVLHPFAEWLASFE